MTAARLIRPEPQIPFGRTAADGHDHGLQRRGVEREVLDRALGRAHAEGQPAAFEGRAGRAGRAGEPVAVADHDLGVGPDVHEERQLLGPVDPRAHHPRHDVPAHVARDAGVDQRGDVLAQLHPEVAGLHRGVEGRRRDVGRAPDRTRVDPEQQLGHGRVAGQGDGGDVLGVDPGAAHDPAQDAVDRADHHVLHAVEAAGLLGVDDARDDVLAVADLPVELGVLGLHLARDQVDHLAVDGGRPDVHGDREAAAAGVAGLQVDQAGAPVRPHGPHEGGRHPEILLPQHVRNLADEREVDPQAVLVEMALEVGDDAAHVRQVVARRGRGEFEVALFDRRQEEPLLLQVGQVEAPDPGGAPRGGGPVQDAGIHGRLDRDAHGHVALEDRTAGLPVAFRDVRGAQPLGDPALHLPGLDPDAALAADALAAAGGVDVHPGLERRLDDGGARRHGDRGPVWEEGDVNRRRLRLFHRFRSPLLCAGCWMVDA